MLLSLIFALYSNSAFAGNASVVAAHGDAGISGKSGERPAKIGAPVNDGETVHSGKDGMLIVGFPDGSRLKLKADSKMQVHIDRATAEPTEAELIEGAAFALIAKREHRHFQVKTKSAIAGVRGTEFFVSNEKNNFWLCVQDGAVDVTPSGKTAPILVKEGLGILVEPGKTPDAPKPYAWTKKLNWNMDPDKGEVDDHTSIHEEYKNLLKYKYD